MAAIQTTQSVLSDALLERFRERAATYDRENRFFDEDFVELRDAGYLDLPIPRDLGAPNSPWPRWDGSSAGWPPTPRPRPWR